MSKGVPSSECTGVVLAEKVPSWWIPPDLRSLVCLSEVKRWALRIAGEMEMVMVLALAFRSPQLN